MVDNLILIGASTGGPGHINTIVKGLPQHFRSTVIIAQHMGLPFVPSFIKQLSSLTTHRVLNVKDNMIVEPSTVYVCSGESRLVERDGEIRFAWNEHSPSLYTPDIDMLFLSAAFLPSHLRTMGVILTGIGNDGTLGVEALHQSGGYCLFESEESSIVYGMPRSASERVPEGDVGSLTQIVEKIIAFGSAHAGMV